MALHLNKLESPLPKDALFQVWLKLTQWFWRKNFLNIFRNNFTFLLLSPLGKGRDPLFEQILITCAQGGFVLCLVEIGPVVLEKKIFKYLQYNFTFSLLSPLFEKGVALYLNNFESPPPKDALCQVWLKLAKWYWRKRF